MDTCQVRSQHGVKHTYLGQIRAYFQTYLEDIVHVLEALEKRQIWHHEHK